MTLPVGAMLAPARQAWVRGVGGWLPRIETIASVAGSHSWLRATPTLDEPGREAFGAPLSLDPIDDRLMAARNLGRQDWARQWAKRDRRGYEFALDQVVEAGHVWLRALQATQPHAREARLQAWRLSLQDQLGSGPGGREHLLLAWALEWVAASAEGGLVMDGVYGERPSAWLAVSVGTTVLPGSEGELMQAALRQAQASGTPVRWWAAQVPLACNASAVQLGVGACSDLLDEARQAAAQVLCCAAARPNQSEPVALLALDRSVIRHVRALLEDSGLSVADETGWLLSTTRAAAACTRLLAASSPRATTDELLDWLKSGWVRTVEPDDILAGDPRETVGLFERWCRRQGLLLAWPTLTQSELRSDEASLSAVASAHLRMPDRARLLWAWAHQAVLPLQALWGASRPTLQQWLHGLRRALVQSGVNEALQTDAAGSVLWRTLRLDALDDGDVKLPELHRLTRMDGAGFQRWLADTLEAVTFRPESGDQRPDVVITTLARAALRPFHAVVMPGADESQLGALGAPSGWLGVRLREAMGLVTPMQARQAHWEAFCLVSTRPILHAFYRKSEGSAPKEVSPWLSRWVANGGGTKMSSEDPRLEQHFPAVVVRDPQPVMGAHGVGLPTQLSATQYELLRQCPYRFFAQVVLGLQGQDELEEGLARSDHGSWLHETLRAFHEARDQRLALATFEADVALWLNAAREAAAAMGLLSEAMRAHFRPHELALPDLALAYVKWLHHHELDGWRVQACEVTRERVLDLPEGGEGLSLKLIGQLDRVDTRRRDARSDGGRDALVIDYKSGSVAPLKQKVKAGSEDTQLAFYAALSDDVQRGDELSAAYVHLDARKVEALCHEDVRISAEQLMAQLSRDWVRMHNGVALKAMGDGAACDHCAMRGLCRKDRWHSAGLEGA